MTLPSRKVHNYCRYNHNHPKCGGNEGTIERQEASNVVSEDLRGVCLYPPVESLRHLRVALYLILSRQSKRQEGRVS
jgi:hypothetical protein